MNKVLVICGATASGKTSLAVECAKKLNTEVISADSQLIYKGLNVGTAKPTADEMCGVKHHMIDIVEPTESFNVGNYRETALPIMKKLLSENKIPVICGGTGFYINSLLFDFSYGNIEGSEEVRRRYAEFLDQNGKEALFERLKEVDPQTAIKLHVNDVKRVIRALEIYELSGKRKSEQNDKMISEYDYLAVAINHDREKLYERINMRVDTMLENGLVEEVEGLLSRGIDEKYQCMQAIGYKEVLAGLINGDLRSTMCDIIKQNTRHYAKRQIVFFKKLPNIVWLEPEQATAEYITELLNEH